jgi:hypothetical protein
MIVYLPELNLVLETQHISAQRVETHDENGFALAVHDPATNELVCLPEWMSDGEVSRAIQYIAHMANLRKLLVVDSRQLRTMLHKEEES